MKTINKLIITLLALTGLLATTSIFADVDSSTEDNSDTSYSSGSSESWDDSNTEDDSNVSEPVNDTATWTEAIIRNREQIQANWAQFHDEYGFIKQFLKKPATKEEAKKIEWELKNTLKAYHESVKALIKEGREAIKNNTFNKETFNTKAEEIFNKHVEVLSAYVDEAKMDAFKKFMEAKKATILVNKELRIQNANMIKNEIKNKFQEKVKDKVKEKVQEKKKSRLSESNKKKVMNFIDKIPADKKIEKINKIISKIDVLIEKITNENTRALLMELKELLNSKLENNTNEDEIINEIIAE